ncbi:MAG: hypothetical protein OEZ68_04340 [Gammaproteobacteria bacterium]|nr:hypothetical protein [Gammaproteobacteria bacterium]MDH5800017.1 hypothetical protein [Gammaproteobacteria bacterium]
MFRKNRILMYFAVLFFSACFGPKTPQEVTRAFWESVLQNDAEDVVEYSTLIETKQYDRFSKDWVGFEPSWGRVVMEGDNASVETTLRKPGAQSEERHFTTHLVRRNKQWIVDYSRTADEVQGGAIAGLFGKLGEVGKELSKQLESAAKEFGAEIERMAEELEQRAEQWDPQADNDLERFAEELRNNLQELLRSIQKALEQDGMSEQDRRVLQQVVSQLKQDLENIQPNIRSISQVNRNVATAMQRLLDLETRVSDRVREQWQDMAQSLEADMKSLLGQLSSGAQEL